MSQSRRMSLIEAAINVVVGYVLAVAMQCLVFPWFDLHPSLRESLAIGALFMATSLLRGYVLRRVFERFR